MQQISSNSPSSPNKLSKKQSLSILSSSTLNQINNLSVQPSKPLKERVVSETTGLIKFSIKQPASSPQKNTSQLDDGSLLLKGSDRNTRATQKQQPNEELEEIDSQNVLFKMATKQRQILELKEQLKQAESELSDLESEYKTQLFSQTPAGMHKQNLKERSSIIDFRKSLKNSTSIINLGPTSSAQDTMNKTQVKLSQGFAQFTNNFTNTSNGLFNKGKELWGSQINKNIQAGQEIITQILKPRNDDSDNSDATIDESMANQFEYSVDFDLDHLNKMNTHKNVHGTILEDLENEQDSESRLEHLLDSSDDEDYGGDTIRI
ncbi:hypothetical protein DAMA08_037470 [Martiniozyma asiatica (nom. inval.)]|nr:hypothetical protein DAMA08_037470 [Martiniozyma asiatica]